MDDDDEEERLRTLCSGNLSSGDVSSGTSAWCSVPMTRIFEFEMLPLSDSLANGGREATALRIARSWRRAFLAAGWLQVV